jgi:hypothetical protein
MTFAKKVIVRSDSHVWIASTSMCRLVLLNIDLLHIGGGFDIFGQARGTDRVSFM